MLLTNEIDPESSDYNWTNWIKFPAPQRIRDIRGPKGPGIYQIKNEKTDELILFGIGGECQERMKSLMPAPYGSGTRNADDKREYVLEHYKVLVYRFIATKTRDEAAKIENFLRGQNNHLFNR